MDDNGLDLRVVLVDLDDTVYPRENGIMKEVGRLILRYMVERMQIPEDQASSLRRRYYEDYGTTLRGLQAHHQVDTEEYLRFVHDIPLEKFLHRNPLLDQALASIPQEKVIFTNSTAEHAEEVLRLVGVRSHFSQIIDLRALQYANKPDLRAYHRALGLVGAPVEACLVVEDSLRNLVPARALGMATVLVTPDGMDAHDVDFVIRDLSQLPQAVRRLEEGGGGAGQQSERQRRGGLDFTNKEV